MNRAAAPSPLAFIFCGQGSVYPGMGRELYDSFPLVREGMERVAAAADWDMLALMDERDRETIISTRWQQPYLLMLEYGIFHYLTSLGARPSVFCGHSLGELVALCAAGAYSPETAYRLINTRAMTINTLEDASDHSSGMLVVHAGLAEIAAVIKAYPSVSVCNVNSPRQIVLGGAVEDLDEIRKHFRKHRIPAMKLGVSMAFHHAGMRAARPLNTDGLAALEIARPMLPVLSNVTTLPYPDDPVAIRSLIFDLDENPVQWVGCVERMRQEYGIGQFVEIGPSSVLCTLIKDCDENAGCMPTCERNKEAATLRATVDSLSRLGHLRSRPTFLPGGETLAKAAARPSQSPDDFPELDAFPELSEPLLLALMKATGHGRDELTPGMLLKEDLGIRSIQFSLLLQEIEAATGLAVELERLAAVESLADLDAALRGAKAVGKSARERNEKKLGLRSVPPLIPLESDSAIHEKRTDFSHFRDLWLADYRPWPEMKHSVLSVTRKLEALIDGARRMAPRLHIQGARDMQWLMPVPCPPGITREGRILLSRDADGEHLLARLLIRNVTPTWRRTEQWSECARGRIRALATSQEPVPLWAQTDFCPGKRYSALDMERFYRENTGFGERYRLLGSGCLNDAGQAEAAMVYPEIPDSADPAGKAPAYAVYALEAAQQLCVLAAGQRTLPVGIGQLCLGLPCAPGEPLRIQMRICERTAHGLKADAQVLDAVGRIRLAARAIALAFTEKNAPEGDDGQSNFTLQLLGGRHADAREARYFVL